MSKQKKVLTGHFPAKLLWALEPIVRHARETGDLRFHRGSMFMEPAPEGGAFVGAISAHALAVFHSQEAWCNSAMTLDMPLQAFEVVDTPDHLHYSYCGETVPVFLPEWMLPGTVWVTSAGTFILPIMRAPCFAEEHDEFQPTMYERTASGRHHTVGLDYSASEGVPLEWRKPLVKASTETTGAAFRSISANPHVVSLLDRIYDLAIGECDPDKPPRIYHRPTGTEEEPGPILVTITGRPDIVATYMGLKTDATAAPGIPWSFLKPAKETLEQAHG